ncbi:MAG: hypothetical protein HY650_12520 [Acidobacteria bacterium]|nr:hypothetical protein [Acidobacteriota bacterium]
MSEIKSNAVSSQDVPVARYHAAVLGFFVVSLAAQAMLARQYISLLPSSLRGMLQTVVVLGFGVQTALLVSTIPLAMVFIFGWLYLSDTQVKVRQLYPIVVLAIAPLLLFMFFSLAYLLTARGIDPSVRERMAVISRTLEAEIAGTQDATKMNPAHFQELGDILKGDMSRRWAPINLLLPLPLAICCLLCGWLLAHRLAIGPIRAYLIPITFVASVALVRWATASTSQDLVEKLKGMVQP